MDVAKRKSAAPGRPPCVAAARNADVETWIDGEAAGSTFKDERLGRRFKTLLKRIGGAMGESIPLVCQDWANTKAAYRFFSNYRVSEEDILGGHFQSTRARFAASEGPILVLQDTTEFTYQRERPELIGLTKSINTGKDKAGRLRKHAVCGILMHSSLAVTTDGLRWGWRPSSSGPERSSKARPL
jgi:Transposase DNA-binding